MRALRFDLLVAVSLVGLTLAACGPVMSQRVDKARVAVEAARAAGAPARAPEQFQVAERELNESRSLLASGSVESLYQADYHASVAISAAESAMATAKLKVDLEKAQTEAQAAKQEAVRAAAGAQAAKQEAAQAAAGATAAEQTARAAESRAERAENQAAEIRRQAAVTVTAPAPVLPDYLRYVVKRGDTLAKIAARPEIYGNAGQWRRIYDANRDIIGKDRKLKVGQVLMILKP